MLKIFYITIFRAVPESINIPCLLNYSESCLYSSRFGNLREFSLLEYASSLMSHKR